MFTLHTTVRLPDTDAAGILFFGNYFRLAHDAYESFMESIGFSFKYIMSEADFLILIAHAEADYKKPLQLGENVMIQMTAEKIGATSFVLTYRLHDSLGEAAASLKTVHVAVDKRNQVKIPLPSKLREELSRLR